MIKEFKNRKPHHKVQEAFVPIFFEYLERLSDQQK